MAKRKTRFGIQSYGDGGTSIGWTSINAFYRCPRRAYWGLLHDGSGVQLPPMPPGAPLLYGQLWHAAYRAHWMEHPIKEALTKHLEEEDLSAYMFTALVDEVLRDVEWYWEQSRGGTKLKVLACEEELQYEVTSPWTGHKHLLRGTPDIVGMDLTSGSVLMPDHKTYGVISYTQEGTLRLYTKPRPDAIQKYQVTRQFPYYMFLWNGLHPEQACHEALLNMVPSHITTVLNLMSERKGNKEPPRIHRVPLEAYAPSYIQEVGHQAIRLCDKISASRMMTLSERLATFNENESACVGFGGNLCSFYSLDRETKDVRDVLLSETYVRRE